jgi:hypothetical protein
MLRPVGRRRVTRTATRTRRPGDRWAVLRSLLEDRSVTHP